MSEQKPKVPKKGAAKTLTKKFTELRKQPLSKRVFEIIEENYERTNSQKKSAKPDNDLGVQMALWGYSELDALLAAHPNAKKGFLVDTNILVAATYELDKYNEIAVKFIDSLADREIPLYCNVNIRAEFLEIHRRIVISESLLDLEEQCNKASLPPNLASELTSYRSAYERKRKTKPDEPPRRLSESEIKVFKLMMINVAGNRGDDLWTQFCDNNIGTKIIKLWEETEQDFGLNFLSLRKEDQELHLNRKPDWEDVVKLMSNPALSSADAMIVNMFYASKFEVIASSDVDIGIALKKSLLNDKHAIVPDELKAQLQFIKESESFLSFADLKYPPGSKDRWVYVVYLVALNTAIRGSEIWVCSQLIFFRMAEDL